MKFTKESINVAVPLIFSLLLQNLINVADTIFLGRVGEIELGASAIAGVFYMSLYFIGQGFGVGEQALIARRNGEGNFVRIGVIIWQSILFLLLLGVIVTAITYFIAPIGFRATISSSSVCSATLDYLYIRILGLIPAFITIAYRSFFVAIKDTKVLMYSSVAMTFTNLILNYALIFGIGPIVPLGIKGAAIASVIAEFVGLIFFLIYINKIDISKYMLKITWSFNRNVIKRILNVSVWTMLQYFITAFVWMLFFMAIEQLGERALAVANVIRSISMLLFVIISAFGIAASSLAGNAVGEGNNRAVFEIANTNLVLSFITLAPVMALCLIFPQQVISLFTNNHELILASVDVLYAMLFCTIITIPGYVLFNIISGTGNTMTSLIIEVIAIVLYIIALILIVIYRPPVWLCWLLEFVYWFTIFVLSYLYLKRANWWERAL